MASAACEGLLDREWKEKKHCWLLMVPKLSFLICTLLVPPTHHQPLWLCLKLNWTENVGKLRKLHWNIFSWNHVKYNCVQVTTMFRKIHISWVYIYFFIYIPQHWHSSCNNYVLFLMFTLPLTRFYLTVSEITVLQYIRNMLNLCCINQVYYIWPAKDNSKHSV